MFNQQNLARPWEGGNSDAEGAFDNRANFFIANDCNNKTPGPCSSNASPEYITAAMVQTRPLTKSTIGQPDVFDIKTPSVYAEFDKFFEQIKGHGSNTEDIFPDNQERPIFSPFLAASRDDSFGPFFIDQMSGNERLSLTNDGESSDGLQHDDLDDEQDRFAEEHETPSYHVPDADDGIAYPRPAGNYMGPGQGTFNWFDGNFYGFRPYGQGYINWANWNNRAETGTRPSSKTWA